MATSRPRRGSRARYTSPMPPAPRGPFTSYAPSLVPLGSAMPYTPVLVIVFASTAAGQLFGCRGVYEKGAVRRNAPLLAHVRPGGRQFPNCRESGSCASVGVVRDYTYLPLPRAGACSRGEWGARRATREVTRTARIATRSRQFPLVENTPRH